jgi:preprotein translocase subunit SecF
LFIFGGSTIHNFVLTLLIGIFIGTYSSIFNATPLLVVWQNWSEKRKLKANK